MNEIKENKFQFILLQCPYDLLDRPEVKRRFSDFIGLKLKSYKEAYPENVLPVGPYDFIADLGIIYDLEYSSDPIMIFKILTLERCLRFNLGFEIVEVLKRCQNTETHQKMIEQVIKTHEPNKIGYISSWAMDPIYRTSSSEKKWVSETGLSLFAHYFIENKLEVVFSGAALRFKTDKLNESVGFRAAKMNDEPLNHFKAPYLFDEETKLMKLDSLSGYVISNLKLREKTFSKYLQKIQQPEMHKKTAA